LVPLAKIRNPVGIGLLENLQDSTEPGLVFVNDEFGFVILDYTYSDRMGVAVGAVPVRPLKQDGGSV
jgi:hypothetical protein